MGNMSDSLRLVSLSIGQDNFEELLIRLPDEFFGLSAERKELVWNSLLSDVNQGIEDAKDLANLAAKYVGILLESTFG